MKRELMAHLVAWKANDVHLPLLLRGARQVGKTFLVRDFAKKHFEQLVEINFELEPQYSSCFESLAPKDILARIELLSYKTIAAGTTLLFLDEIQMCPNAIMALRYFKENCPQLHVVAAGSLLEFALEDENLSFPVGRIQYLYLKPLSFREYLSAMGHDKLVQWIKTIELDTKIPEEIDHRLQRLMREYTIIGGMPMVVQRYLETNSFRECQNYQTLILQTYHDDFAKYAAKTKHKYLQQVFQKAPGLVGKQIKYSEISSEMESRYLKDAIAALNKAGVLITIKSASGAGLPLNTYANEKKFKLLFLDVGLVRRASKLEMELLLTEDIMLLNQGALAEQWVGQELLAYQDCFDEPELFYWFRDKKSSMAEVDYLTSFGKNIIPIEVKAGKTGTLRSLHLFLQEHHVPFGVRISAQPLSFHDNILSVPFYLMSEISRLIKKYETDILEKK